MRCMSTDHGKRKEKLRPLLVYEYNGRSLAGRTEKNWTPQMKNDEECFFGPPWSVSEKDFPLEKKRDQVIKHQR